MVTRELLQTQSQTQSILNSASSSTSQTSTTSSNSFKDLLKTKSSSDTFSQTESTLVEKKSTSETQAQSSSSLQKSKTDYSVESTEEKTPTEKKVATDETSTSDDQVKANATDDDYEDAMASLTEEEKNLEAFKDFLKKKTGLSDEEVNDLLALMGTDIQSLISEIPMETLSTMDFSNLIDAANVLQNIEVNQMLDMEVDENLLNSLTENLTDFAEVLANVSTSDSNETLENLAAALKAQVEALENAMSEDSGKSVKDILSEMSNSSVKEALNNQATQASDAENLAVDSEETEEIVLTKASTDTESQSNNSKDSSAKSETVASQNNDQEAVANTSSQDQKIFEATLKNLENRQVPRQEIFTQVMDAIKSNLTVNQQGSQLTVKLSPEQLGSVEVKLSMHKGIVLAEIKVENETVKAAIETNLNQLKQSLQEKGYQTNQISVTVDSGDKGDGESSAYEQQQENQQNNLKSQNDEADSFLEKIGLTYRTDEFEETSTIDFFG